MAVYVYVATSLDGFIAASDGGLDWLMETPNPEQSDYGFAEFMSGIDAIVMGRNTFETVLTFGDWPYSKPVFVLSRTLDEVPEGLRDRVEVVSDDPVTLVSQLGERGFSNPYVDGGRVIQSFLEEDLVDELIITRIPILLGDGIPLFGKLSKRQMYAHRNTEALNDQLSKSYYSRVGIRG